MSVPSVPLWVCHQYYRHGLFCASHPRLVLAFTLVGVLWTCFPLFTLPLYTGKDDIEVYK